MRLRCFLYCGGASEDTEPSAVRRTLDAMEASTLTSSGDFDRTIEAEPEVLRAARELTANHARETLCGLGLSLF